MFLWFFGRKTKKGSDVQVSRQDSRVARATILERRYREDVPYALPKDLEEGQRLTPRLQCRHVRGWRPRPPRHRPRQLGVATRPERTLIGERPERVRARQLAAPPEP